MPDRELVCMTCKQKFVLRAGEEKWFEGQGYQPPKRCRACRKKRKAERDERAVAAAKKGTDTGSAAGGVAGSGA